MPTRCNFGTLLFGGQQEIRRQGHDLPRHQKQHAVAGHDHYNHSCGKEPEKQRQFSGAGLLAGRPVGERVDRSAPGYQKERQQEDRREQVDGKEGGAEWQRPVDLPGSSRSAAEKIEDGDFSQQRGDNSAERSSIVVRQQG